MSIYIDIGGGGNWNGRLWLRIGCRRVSAVAYAEHLSCLRRTAPIRWRTWPAVKCWNIFSFHILARQHLHCNYSWNESQTKLVNWRAMASSIRMTFAKWAVFGTPRHRMPCAWRHSCRNTWK